jgi:hypothetical protein
MTKGRHKKEYRFKKSNKSTNKRKKNNEILSDKTDLFIENYISFIGFLGVYFLIGLIIRLLIGSTAAMNHGIIFTVIVMYYTMRFMYYDNTQEEKKSIIWNILGVISLYNILITLNIFKFIELSSSYAVTNIFYFYVSFFIFTINWDFYGKLTIIVDLIYAMINKSNKNFKELSSTISFLLGAFIYPIFVFLVMYHLIYMKKHPYSKFFVILSIAIIITYISITIYNKFKKGNENINNIHRKIIEKIKKNKELIDDKNNWFIEVFNIKKISNVNFIDLGIKKMTSKQQKDLYILLLRFFPFIIFLLIPLKDNYYILYLQNNDICINEELKDKKIIKLKNDNVLIEKLKNNETYLSEVTCEKKKVEFRYSKKNDN